jgi:hypothetical protein
MCTTVFAETLSASQPSIRYPDPQRAILYMKLARTGTIESDFDPRHCSLIGPHTL